MPKAKGPLSPASTRGENWRIGSLVACCARILPREVRDVKDAHGNDEGGPLWAALVSSGCGERYFLLPFLALIVNSCVCGFRYRRLTLPRTFGPMYSKMFRPSVMFVS